jgi:hypothetical protein
MEALELDPFYLFGSILLKNWTSESYKGEERRRFAGKSTRARAILISQI